MKALASAISACALLLVSPATHAQQDPWDQAAAAYETQHFDRALSLYEQLARDGSAQAAEIAGAMLFYGEPLYGAQVRRARARAAVLLQLAAKDGRAAAQFLLSRISVARSTATDVTAASADAWSKPGPSGASVGGD